MTSEEQAKILHLALDRLRDEPVIELTKEMEIKERGSRTKELIAAFVIGFIVTAIFRLA